MASKGRFASIVRCILLILVSASIIQSAQWDTMTTFPNLAWIGPPVSTYNNQTLGDMVGAGLSITLTGGWAEPSREENLRALDSAEKYGMKLIITDNRWGWFSGFGGPMPSDPSYLARLDSIVDDYKNHPAYMGLKIIDEPSGSQYHQLQTIRNHILQRDPEHLVYINMAAASEAGLTIYMDTVQPQMLSFDTYPITQNGMDGMFFNTLETFRRVSLRYNVPVWAFAMCIKLDGWPIPTKGTMALQQYGNLAYGFKGLQSFTYANIIGPAPVNRDGTRSPQYDVFKELNTQIMNIAPLLKKMTSLGVSHSLPLPEGTKGFSADSCIQYTTGNTILAGWFKDSTNQRYVLLVNREYLVPGTTRLFTKQVTGLVEVSKQTGAELPAIIPTGNNITLNFEPGEGRLFRVVTGVLTDAGKPVIDTVCTMPPDSVVVVFSKRVSRTTAQNAANYVMNKGILVNSALLRSDSTTVVLAVSPLSRDTVYTLQVSNVQDLSGHAMDVGTRTLKWYSCILDWSLNEGAGDTLHDGSGLGNLGYRFWAADWQDGKFGKAINFAGGNLKTRPDYFTHVVNNFTMMLWVKPTQPRTETTEKTSSYYYGVTLPFTVSPYNGDMYGTDNAGAGLSVGTNGLSVCELDGDAPYPYHSPTLLVYPTTITDWTHVAMVYDNKVTKLYVNGALVRTGLTSIKTVHPSGQLGVGYTGGVDEYKVFSYALSQSEIAALMQAGTAINVHAAIPENGQLKVWPSPFSGNVQISVPRGIGGGAKLLVYDISGKLLKDLSSDIKNRTIAWQPVLKGSGVYIVKLVQGNKVTSAKISALR